MAKALVYANKVIVRSAIRGRLAMLMCFVITAATAGIDQDYLRKVLQAYQLAMPVAFVCVLMVRPVVMRLVAITVHPH